MIHKIHNFIFTDSRMAYFWLIVRIYVGWQWLEAGWAKVSNPLWTGWHAGAPLSGFMNSALAKATGTHPDVQNWYAVFLKLIVIPHVNLWSHLVAYGEFFVGIGLLLGALTSFAAFFGAFMNMNYLLAGTVSINPVLLIVSVFIICSGKLAGKIGLDGWFRYYMRNKNEKDATGKSR